MTQACRRVMRFYIISRNRISNCCNYNAVRFSLPQQYRVPTQISRADTRGTACSTGRWSREPVNGAVFSHRCAPLTSSSSVREYVSRQPRHARAGLRERANRLGIEPAKVAANLTSRARQSAARREKLVCRHALSCYPRLSPSFSIPRAVYPSIGYFISRVCTRRCAFKHVCENSAWLIYDGHTMNALRFNLHFPNYSS